MAARIAARSGSWVSRDSVSPDPTPGNVSDGVHITRGGSPSNGRFSRVRSVPNTRVRASAGTETPPPDPPAWPKRIEVSVAVAAASW